MGQNKINRQKKKKESHNKIILSTKIVQTPHNCSLEGVYLSSLQCD